MEITRFIATRWFRDSFTLFFFMMLTGFYALHLGQDSNFDLRNYHWYNAFNFLHHRFDIDIAAASKPSHNNPLLDALNYLIIELCHKSRRAEFTLGALHGISLYFLFQIALIFFKEFPFKLFYSLLAVLIGATGVASLYQIGTTYNESQVTIFIMT